MIRKDRRRIVLPAAFKVLNGPLMLFRRFPCFERAEIVTLAGLWIFFFARKVGIYPTLVF